jgi:hypothetical protein
MNYKGSLVGRLSGAVLVTGTLALTAGALPTLVAPPTASAYTHEWACVRNAYEKCYDNSGKTFNPWHFMSFDGESVGGYCVKGETSGGGVIQFDCETGHNFAAGTVCTSTETHAYGYSNINSNLEAGLANTTGGC